MKQAESSREDSHLVIGGLADGGLADGRGIQRDTLSRWRSGVRIPPGSPNLFSTHKSIPYIGRIADPHRLKCQWLIRQCGPPHTPTSPENRIGQNADTGLPSAKHPSLFRRITSPELVLTSLLLSQGRYHEDGTGTP
ncbi:hypothetical protein ES703_93627 [subsurface metagenome]